MTTVSRRPNLFIVGAAKAGTTSLRNYLNAHPEIYMSPIKEPNYFGSDINPEDFSSSYRQRTDIDWDHYFSKLPLEEKHIGFMKTEDNYLKLFQPAPVGCTYLGEASTSYLYSKEAANEVFQFNPEAKVIAILRHPVSRLVSHLKMDVAANSQLEKNVLKAVESDYLAPKKGWGVSHLYVELSMYHLQLRRYINLFPSENILILDFERLKNQPRDIFTEIEGFLNLKTPIPHIGSQVHNRSIKPKNKLVSKLAFLGKRLPKSFKGQLKNQLKFLFEDVKVELPEGAEDYLEDILLSDWEATKTLLAEFKHNGETECSK